MKRRVNTKAFAGLFACIFLIVAAVRLINKKPADKTEKEPAATSASQTFIETAGTGTQSGDTTGSLNNSEPAVSVDSSGASYVDNIMIVNKTYSLPATYNPGALDSKVQSAFDEMSSDAKGKNLTIWIASGYRSYEDQKTLYDKYVAIDGQTEADTYSSRPGHSEHQTGLCFDLNTVEDSFARTDEGKWVAENCWKYGFIIRYPEGKEDVTGYKYEPWHLRYVGKDIAKDIYDRKICLEEYLGVKSEYEDSSASTGMSTSDNSSQTGFSLSTGTEVTTVPDIDSDSDITASPGNSDDVSGYETGIKFY
ncbi:MAG: M15 family metallopeptidase [Oscillospiraceae bacterium]|nr:M15 family metallopeptidase [Oscillospiraceae bacterium]